MNQIFLNTLVSGLRARSLQSAFVFAVVLVSFALLAGSFSARQPQTVVLDVGLSSLRFSLVLLAIVWVQELVTKEIDRKIVIFALTYPISRGEYLMGRFAGITFLLGLAAAVMALLLVISVPWAGGGYEQSVPVKLQGEYWAAIAGIWVDVVVVAAFTLWIATLSTVSVLPLAVGAAFAIACRSLGVVRQYLAAGADGDKVITGTFRPILDVTQWILPDLSRLDWRAWPMYGDAPAEGVVGWSLAMAGFYASGMLILAVRAFSRREFE